MRPITPFLWFESQAEEAANFYVDLFPSSSLDSVTRYGEGMPLPAGTVMTANFTLNGQPFVALNGGPHYQMTPAISFVIHCDGQEEVDYFWDRLLEGGQAQMCGWLTDRFGVTWQVVPIQFDEMVSDLDAERVGRVMAAMMQMVKMDVAGLKRAYDGDL